jgi:hypothetical protein
MMVALLLYAYAVGIYSSRRIAKACVERVDFMAIVALDAPDFRTISEFRRRHLAALSALFVQVLERVGLAKLGHVTCRLVHHHRHRRQRADPPHSRPDAGDPRQVRYRALAERCGPVPSFLRLGRMGEADSKTARRSEKVVNNAHLLVSALPRHGMAVGGSLP